MEYRIPTNKLFSLTIISFIIFFLAGRDASKYTKLYNEIDLNNNLTFKIIDKYNKKSPNEKFPDLNFNGQIIENNEHIEIKISRGDFDKHQIEQIIKIYKSPNNEYMTEYEINNQMIIHIGKKGYSFVYIPVMIFVIIGLFSGISLLKRFYLVYFI
ncbi:hypothetical protein CXF68_10565 [Tenacibaculum sp. Bg11-29]|uniref:hypothetical protein n=1 Tax=Tenacibaculum sp. Bg11-29 TaxID=2058306 RepID=UPI000C34CDE7|nr:hypothetical protein [Tenacibaculum sp. Bg11-29]PKH51099.1 hypothetical protein CXF68_10565 [Tenacibaculum sp. Bg11-29]